MKPSIRIVELSAILLTTGCLFLKGCTAELFLSDDPSVALALVPTFGSTNRIMLASGASPYPLLVGFDEGYPGMALYAFIVETGWWCMLLLCLVGWLLRRYSPGVSRQ